MSLQNKFIQTDKVADRLTDAALKQRLRPAYKQSLDAVRKDVAIFWEKYAKEGVLSIEDAAKYNRLANLEKNITKEMQRLGNQQVRITTATIKDVYQESYYRVAFGVESEVQARLGFGELPTKQIEASVLNPLDRIGWPDRTREQLSVATRQIKEEITQGIIQGKSYSDVAATVAEKTNMAVGRAERIVQTEAHRAREQGKKSSLEHAHNKGVEMQKVWVSTLDNETRDTHADMDGQAVPVYNEDGEPGFFTSPEGFTAEYPGGFGVASEDINCRCTTRGEIEGYSPEVRRTREDSLIDYKTYKEYAKEKGWPLKYKGPEPRV